MTTSIGSIGVGIIGAGWFGERHAVALKQAGFHLVGACRDSPVGLDAFTAQHGGIAYPDPDALLADLAVEAVVIATPHQSHAQLSIRAAGQGKAILLEKPMAPTLAECDAIARAVADTGVPFMVGHTQRFAPSVAAAKALLGSGSLGRVRFGSSTMVKLWMEPNRRPWHLRRDTGGGMLMTAGIHALDRLLWLVDQPVRSVFAVASAAFHDQESDDSALMLLRFADGTAATVTSIAYRDGAPYGGTELVCDHGVLQIDPGGGLRVGQGGTWRDVPLDLPADVMGATLVEEWRRFGAMMRDGTPSPVDAASARHTMACIVAALDSARTGSEATVDHGR
ncbi:MAG: Gfo/Idh/MocA family oxidoreductase [Burkholderiales bacterium]|nr:Gfo/Idh/MocA family oxidoreductase [Burkholderiales bacterium]